MNFFSFIFTFLLHIPKIHIIFALNLINKLIKTFRTMRTKKDVMNSIVNDKLKGNSTVFFEHGFPLPKMGTKILMGVDTKNAYFRSGKVARTRFKSNELMTIEKALTNYFDFVSKTV